MQDLLEQIIECSKNIGEYKTLVECSESNQAFWNDKLIQEENKLKELREQFNALLNEI
jgi:hypothetical protein